MTMSVGAICLAGRWFKLSAVGPDGGLVTVGEMELVAHKTISFTGCWRY